MMEAQHQLTEEVLLDWNESPLGPPQAAVDRVINIAQNLHRYPRGLTDEVTSLAAKHFGIPPSRVLLTSGVDEAIDIALSLAVRAWGVVPGFDGYTERAKANAKPFHGIPLDSAWQPGAVPGTPGKDDILFLAQPNNPTGNLFDPQWIENMRENFGHVLLDETYQAFSTRSSYLLASEKDPRLLIYKSFSKAMGLAGIRIGCLVGQPDVIARLEVVRRFMPIDAVSLAAAAGVFSDSAYMDRLSQHILTRRPQLFRLLEDSSLFEEVRDTEANFILVRPCSKTAASVMRTLANDRIRVKSCTSFGMADWLRISVGSWPDQERLRRSLARVPA